jgi:hypothetical protein
MIRLPRLLCGALASWWVGLSRKFVEMFRLTTRVVSPPIAAVKAVGVATTILSIVYVILLVANLRPLKNKDNEFINQCPWQFPKIISCVLGARENLAGGLIGAGGASGPLLFWGGVYEEHKWIPLPEPHRTIFVVAMFCLAAFWLYVLRCQERVMYGCIEIVAAVLTFYFTVANKFPVETGLDSKEYVTACIQIAAGLYVIVRGLDNIGNGLTPGSRMHRLWWNSRFFSKSRDQ